MGFIDIYKGIIFNEKGDDIKIKAFRKNADLFHWGNPTRKYVIDLLGGSSFKIKGFIWNNIYYQYQKDNPLPYSRKKMSEPIINSDLLNTVIENRVARDLNNLSKSGLQQLLTFKNIIIGLAVIGVIWYFASGGKLL